MKNQAAGTVIVVGITAITIAACATDKTSTAAPAQLIMDARDRLVAAVNDCNSRYSYDPENVPGVGEKSLAPQELQWRGCVYSAARDYGKTNQRLAATYEQLISDDIEMTKAIQQGSLTRSARRAKNEQQFARIRRAEEQQMKEAAVAQDRQKQQVHQIVDGMRGLR